MALPRNDSSPRLNFWVQQRWLLAGAGALVILLFGWLAVWRPLEQKMSVVPPLESFNGPRQRVENDIATLTEINKQISLVNQDQTERLKITLPVGQDLPNLVAQLEGIAKKNQIDIAAISFVNNSDISGGAAITRDRGPKLLNINLTLASGSYTQLKTFIADVENSLRLLSVTGVAFNYGSGGASESRRGYIINLASPYLPAN